MRGKLYREITTILVKSLQPEEGKKHPRRLQNRHKTLLDWIPTMVPELWSGDTEVPDTGIIIIIDDAFADLKAVDIAQTWRGVMPDSLTRAIATVVPTHSKAHKTATAISVAVQDKVASTWREYAVIKRNDRHLTKIDNRAANLHARGLLLLSLIHI